MELVRTLALLLLCGLLFLGCGHTSHKARKAIAANQTGWKPTPPAGAWHWTPNGGTVYVPTFALPDLTAILAEVDATPPLKVAGPPGVPLHWKLIILEPGAYPFYYDGKLITAWGHTDYAEKILYCASRDDASQKFVPALSHELGHVYGGPCANHTVCSQ